MPIYNSRNYLGLIDPGLYPKGTPFIYNSRNYLGLIDKHNNGFGVQSTTVEII